MILAKFALVAQMLRRAFCVTSKGFAHFKAFSAHSGLFRYSKLGSLIYSLY
jgi:hypothetical protein